MAKRQAIGVTLAVMAVLLLFPTLSLAKENMINWALGATYTYSMEPNEAYPDTGGQLTDGVYGAPKFDNPAWVGHLRNDFRVITVDLGEVRPIQQVEANFLQEWSVGARYPEEVIVEVSTDGVIWEELGFQAFAPHRMDLDNPFAQPVVFENLDAEGRYVRLIVLVDVWLFMDEIEVWG